MTIEKRDFFAFFSILPYFIPKIKSTPATNRRTFVYLQSRIIHCSHEQRNGIGGNGKNEGAIQDEVDDFLRRFWTCGTGKFDISRSFDAFLVDLYPDGLIGGGQVDWHISGDFVEVRCEFAEHICHTHFLKTVFQINGTIHIEFGNGQILVVCDLFDKTTSQTFTELGFKAENMPVTAAAFSENDTQLTLTYYNDQNAEATITLGLTP